MSLKSIRESYSKLVKAFTDAGVKLNESQKADLDTFIVALEAKMSKQKEATVKVTKKIVTEHLEQEYKKVFESILKHQAQNAELAAKVQSKVQAIKENKKLARKVNNYLDMYVESVLPHKTIVDYHRMQKLEKLHESLKDLLVVDEDAVQAKKDELLESFNKDRKALETQIAKLQVKLNESMATAQKLNAKIEAGKAKELLESKIKDLPTAEANKIKKRFAESTTTEIEKNFNKVLEAVEDEVKEESKQEETTLESEIKDIIENEDVKENDKLNGKPHNNHMNEDEVQEDDLLKKTPHNGDATHNDHIKEDEEMFETLETYKFDKDGDVVLDESDVIDENYMKYLCGMVERIK